MHLLTQLGVPTIAFGGRPGAKPMQAIGGSKAGLASSFSDIGEESQSGPALLATAPEKERAAAAILPGLSDWPLGTLGSGFDGRTNTASARGTHFCQTVTYAANSASRLQTAVCITLRTM